MASKFSIPNTPESYRPDCELNIPSSLISRIGSPLQNFIEVPYKGTFDFSFFETKIQDKSYEESDSKPNLDKVATSESLNFSKTLIAHELQNLLNQSKVLNNKLEINLKVLEESEKRQRKLNDMLEIHKQRKMSKEVNFREEVYCSCSKQCNIF